MKISTNNDEINKRFSTAISTEATTEAMISPPTFRIINEVQTIDI